MAAPGRSRAPHHLAALDGLRGLAALVVVLRHSLGGVDVPAATLDAVLRSPLIVFLNAAGAVQLFFVLSGFVLAASLARNESARQLPQYFVRRVFRIHPPYAFAVLAAWTASFFYATAAAGSGVGGWVRVLSTIHLPTRELLVSLGFPGNAYNQLSVGWSLEVEMVFSFLMPLLLLIAVRGHWGLLLALCLGPLAVGDSGHRVLKFAVDFGVGVALFLERERLGRVLGRLGRGGAALFAAAALGIFVAPFLLGWRPSPAGDPPSILVMVVGAGALTAGAAFVPALARPLAARPCRFLGRVSYSLYLLHYPILILLAPLLVRAPVHAADPLLLAAGVLAVGLPLSALAYRWVERPAIRAGNAACGVIARRMGVGAVGSRLAAPDAPATASDQRGRGSAGST